MTLSSALSITTGVGVPRAVFVDYPLGRTSGKPNDPDDQYSIVKAALRALADNDKPGTVRQLTKIWSSDEGWKERAQRPNWNIDGLHAAPVSDGGSDDRAERSDAPQWQTESDRVAWENAQL